MTDKLFNQQQFYEMYLEFHEKIFSVHVKCMQHLIAVLPFDKLSQIDVEDRFRQKKPILGAENLIIGESDLEKIFDNVFPIIKKYSYRSKEQLLRLDELNDKRKLSLRDMVIALISGDKQVFQDILKQYDISPLILERITELVSAPYLELCAEYFNKKLSQYEWSEPICPICGNQPSMAKTEEHSGKHELWCRFCDTTWNFQAMTCPFCLNDDPASIRLIFPSSRDSIRIDACDKCRNYIKTVNNSIIDEKYNLSVKNVATYHLDLLAKNLGFSLQNHFKFYLESI